MISTHGFLFLIQLDLHIQEEFFWTDSSVVLGYINNTEKKFKVFVANRVQYIVENTETCQWLHVPSKENSGDCASRGLSPDSTRKDLCFNGPSFLREGKENWPKQNLKSIAENDPEVKVTTHHIIVEGDSALIDTLQKKNSSWSRVKRIMGYVIHFSLKLKERIGKAPPKTNLQPLDVSALEHATKSIIRQIQMSAFKKEYEALISGINLRLTSNLQPLSPFLDQESLLRVGGRLSRSNLPLNQKHPLLLPKNHPMTTMILEWCHQKTAHGGRGMTLSGMRSRGFWIIKANSAVRSLLNQCVPCRRLRSSSNQQIMADLPEKRTTEVPPFTHCGVNMFGPFLVKERRSYLKNYAALFTCFSSRAIHIESTSSLETDTFIMSLRRFLSRRGNARSITSDNGTNFVGASNELRKALEEMDNAKIQTFLADVGTDWIVWKRNPPSASNMGGVWERQIRSARKILDSLLATHGSMLNEEALRTLMVEVEAIVNSRPLTVETLSDPNSLPAISPTNLLIQKSTVILPPPGAFEDADLYCRKYWRRVQYLADQFWSRWRKEFLLTLQTRTKWTRRNQRYISKGDVVLMREETRRNIWPLGRVTKVLPDDKGIVRSAVVWVPREKTELHRPCNKLVVLVEVDSPTRSH